MTRAGPVKWQHKVPKSYLDRFADPSIGHLHVFNKPERKTYRRAAKEEAAAFWYYDSADGPQPVESGLARIEGKAAPIIDRIVERRSARWLDREGKDWDHLLRFVAALLVRTDDTRKGISEMLEQVLARLAVMDPKVPRANRKDLVASKTARQIHGGLVMDVDSYLPAMRSMHPLVSYDAPGRLTTCDNPIFRRNHSPFVLPNDRSIGLARQGAEVYLTLSPKVALTLVQESFLAKGGVHRTDFDDQSIEYHRSSVFFSADRCVYAPNGEFVLEQRLAEEHPESLDPDRRRLATGREALHGLGARGAP